uniref:GG16509 n=1 Tax=Drosophila erecta TaxID=7220 RepID=B3P3T1_DROER
MPRGVGHLGLGIGLGLELGQLFIVARIFELIKPAAIVAMRCEGSPVIVDGHASLNFGAASMPRLFLVGCARLSPTYRSPIAGKWQQSASGNCNCSTESCIHSAWTSACPTLLLPRSGSHQRFVDRWKTSWPMNCSCHVSHSLLRVFRFGPWYLISCTALKLNV